MRATIIEQLSQLVGLPLFDIRNAAATAMFQFGERIQRRNRLGYEAEVGEYRLHLECVWRIVGPDGIVVGLEDLNYPEDEDSEWRTFDPGIDKSLYQARMRPLLDGIRTNPPVVEGVDADEVGGFQIWFSNGLKLESFPATSLRGENSEHWRLLGSDMNRHFVVTGQGIGDE